jgi:hypothetical protein
MLKYAVFATGLLTLVLSTNAFALSAGDLIGKWDVIWQNNPQNVNAISLTSTTNNGGLMGTYINDAKSSCSLSGTFYATNSSLTIQIVCPGAVAPDGSVNWSIRMQGTASPDGKVFNGSYQAYTKATGSFQMLKQ